MAIRGHFNGGTRHTLRHHLSGWLAGICTLAALTALAPAPADAANNLVGQSQASAPVSSGSGQYFIEFRSRYAWDYGHTFLVHGRVGEKLTKASVAGLSPVGDNSTAWVIGHYVPVPAETGWTDGDLEDKYISARYRVYMGKEQYDQTMAYIRELQGRSKVWSAEFYNCNAFVGDVARHMGLKVAGVVADLSARFHQQHAQDQHPAECGRHADQRQCQGNEQPGH